jgi:hypothetical protein
MRTRFLIAISVVIAAMLPASAQAEPHTGIKHVEPATGPVPAWFTTNRVHGHTWLTLSTWQDTCEFKRAAAGFKSLGAHAFTRHAKTGDEDPGWPTGFPPERNVVATSVNDAHVEGLRIFTYYWHMSETSLEDLYRDWVCRTWDGTPIRAARRGHDLDITGPLPRGGADPPARASRHGAPTACSLLRAIDRWQYRCRRRDALQRRHPTYAARQVATCWRSRADPTTERSISTNRRPPIWRALSSRGG